MFYVLLPGFSFTNFDELQNLVGTMQSKKKRFYAHEWAHWKDKSTVWNPADEIKVIKQNIPLEETEICFVAKSIGTLITIQLLSDYGELVKKLIFIGIPINDLNLTQQSLYYERLKSFNGQIHIIQNRNDKHGSSLQVQDLLKGVKFSLNVKESETHDYPYEHDVKEVI